MMSGVDGDKYFKNGIDLDIPRKMNSEAPCAGIFCMAIFVQLVMACAIWANKNAEVLLWSEEGNEFCPDGWSLAYECGDLYYTSGLLCVTEDLCTKIGECSHSAQWGRRLDGKRNNATTREILHLLATEEGPAPPQRRLDRALAARMLESNAHVPADVWAFLEERAYQPIVLFLCAAILAAAWLFFLQKAALAAIWGTIIADILLLLAVFLWYKIDFDVWNFACLVGVGLIVVGAIVTKSKINDTAVILTQAMNGLRANARIFAVSAAVQIVWCLYFAQWIAAIIGMHFVVDVQESTKHPGDCELTGQSILGSNWTGLFFVLCYYWVTYFCRNVILMLVTANISGWYFQQPGSESFWKKALAWSVGVQGGGNAMGSAIMGASEYLMNRIGSTWGLVFSMLTPWNWILVCIALALKTVLQTYTKFGLIAMTFSGKTFCESAAKGFSLLSSKLGSAVLTDYLGSRIMAWASYMIALGVGFAAWAWADSVQGISSFGQMDYTLLIISVVLFAYLLSYPFVTLVLLVLIEKSVAGWLSDEWEVRAALNSIMASLFMGCIAMFILNAISKLVVNAMDVIFFCFAVEVENQGRQERFAELYSSIKCSVVEGGIPGQNVVQGSAVGQAPQGPAPAPEPTVVVVGNPVNNNNAASA